MAQEDPNVAAGISYPYPPVPAGLMGPNIDVVPIPGVSSLKSYSLRNGDVSDIEPYLLTSAIPRAYHWVPMNNLPPAEALRCMEGFIRSYLFHLESMGAVDIAQGDRRNVAIMLGVSRAVMTNNYEIVLADINPQEIASPYLAVNFPPATEQERNPAPTYTVLVANNTPNYALLTTPLVLTPRELELVKVYSRCGQAIPPIQGLNLINEGHHYISDKNKSSYKAFLAVEKQVWAPAEMKELVTAIPDVARDVLWHKAGHPIAVSLKEGLATSPAIKVRLEAAKLGSASTRLPAMETDVRAADTYLKVGEAVNAIWETVGGGVNVNDLRERATAIRNMPRSMEELNPAVDIGGDVYVTTRSAALLALKDTLTKNSESIAIAYGFYVALMEATANDTGDTTTDTLRSAHSLTRLRRNSIASFSLGTELYRDYRAMRNNMRQDRRTTMPKLVMEY